MATLINNQGVQYYANKMVQADNRKVGNKSLPSVLNDIDSKIDEFKEVFDREYGSALDIKLKNNTNFFDVGTGIDIDKKSEVENSFTDIELSGNSMVNLINSKTLKEWTTAPQNELGKVVTTEEICIDWSKGINYNSWIQIRNDNSPVFNSLKSNTDYTVFVNILENNPTIGNTKYVGNVISMHLWLINGYDGIRKLIDSNMIGWTSFVYNSQKNNKDVNYTIFGLQPFGTNSDGTKYIDGGKFRMSKEIIVLEGDWTNKPLPSYFEGLKSVGENEENKINISSFEKASLIPDAYFLNNNPSNVGGWSAFPDTLDLKDVIVKFKLNRFLGNDTHIKIWTGVDYDELNGVLGKEVIRYCKTVKRIAFYNWADINCGGGKEKIIEYLTTGALELIVLPNINYGYPFYPYFTNKKDKKETLLNEPLRGLPNGVKDTIEKINGEWKIVRKCLGYVITGQENWSLRSSHENTLTFHCSSIPFKSFKDFDNSHLKMMCDKFICINQDNLDKRYIMGRANGDGFLIGINRNELTSQDLQGFKTWLLNNQVKVVMELETPIIEDIDPVVLQCWKNGYIFIDEVLPVETTHTVALNKPAQIKRNIEELTELRNRVKNLEEFYDQVALEQAYKLELINHSYELDYI